MSSTNKGEKKNQKKYSHSASQCVAKAFETL